MGQGVETLDARDLVLAQIELRQLGERRQILELHDAVVLERQLFQHDAALEPLDAGEVVVAERGAAQRHEPLQIVQLAQVLVVQLQLLDLLPPLLVGRRVARRLAHPAAASRALGDRVGSKRVREAASRVRVRLDELRRDRRHVFGGVLMLLGLDGDAVQDRKVGEAA